MSELLRLGLLCRIQIVLGLALMGLVLAPSAAGAAQLDTVTATGSGGSAGGAPDVFTNINISAQSGTSGQNASGTVFFRAPTILPVTGPVTCLSVTGPDHGRGTVTSPTTAVLNFQSMNFGVVTVSLVDNGGNGLDTMSALPTTRAPTDCSPLAPGSPFTSGGAVVFDASTLPTSKAQCKNGGWRNYPQFMNQGQCVAFVVQQARQNCLAERAKVGLQAFRNKYGLGPYHRHALRRCINQTARLS
jgi:hypothetical protein